MRTPFIVLAGLFLLASFGLKAQKNDPLNCFTAGIKAGVAYGTPIGKMPEGATGKPGFGPVVGFYGRYNFTSKWGLQTGLYYVHKQAKFSTPVEDQAYSYPYTPTTRPDTVVYIDTKFTGDATGEFNNKYIEWPVLGAYSWSDNFSVLAGPYVAYLVNPGNTGTATGVVGWGNSTVENEPFDESVNLNKWDVGVVGGLRYDAPAGFNAEFRVTGGFRSVYSPDFTLYDDKVVNFYMELTAGYRIHAFCKKDGETGI